MVEKHRWDLSFTVGDWVYVHLRPYRQTSLAPSYSKLGKRFYGPFEVIEHIGPVAYKLLLPESSRIHLVFHISLLKLHRGPLPVTPATLPAASTDNHPLPTPLHVLDWKLDHSVSPPVTQVLVQWEGLAPEESTWEHWDELRRIHNLEDKVAFGDGCVHSNARLDDDQKMGNRALASSSNRPRRVIRKPTYLQEYV